MNKARKSNKTIEPDRKDKEKKEKFIGSRNQTIITKNYNDRLKRRTRTCLDKSIKMPQRMP